MLAIAIIMTVILGVIFGITSVVAFCCLMWSNDVPEMLIAILLSLCSAFCIVGTWVMYAHITP